MRRWGLPFAALLVGLCFAPSLPALWHQWWATGTFNHCLIVIPAAAWLVWDAERRAPVPDAGPLVLEAAAPPSAVPSPSVGSVSRWSMCFPYALLFCWAGLWLVARLLSVPVVEQGALVAAIPTLAWALNGHAWARRHRFALLFCLLATPVGEFLVPPLMELTATITVALVRLCGIPVLRDGMQLTLASGDFVVAEACSGIRYLIATVTLGLLFAHLAYRSLNRKLWFMLAAVLAPLLANGLRAWMMVMIAHFTDLQYATGFDHLVYGWLFFGVVIVLLFYAGSLFQEQGASAAPQGNSVTEASSLRQQDVVALRTSPHPGVGAALLATPRAALLAARRAVLLATLLLAWAPLANFAANHVLAAVKGDLPAFAFPQQLGSYAYVGSASFPTPLEYAGADRIDSAAYQQGSNRIYVAAIRYERDRPGHKFVSQSNRPYSFDWNRVASGTITAGKTPVHFDELRPKVRLEDNDVPLAPGPASLDGVASPASLDGAAGPASPASSPSAWRVYSWYVVGGRTTTSAVKAKLLAVADWLAPRSTVSPPTVFLVATAPGAESYGNIGTVAAALK